MEMELWKGHAVFQNLTLLPTALSKHQLPFRVRKGTVARISLNLPWKKLTSEACIVEVSDVYIIVELDPEILIKSAIQAQRSAFHVKEETVTKEEEKGTWQSLIDTVIDNARVNIKNIHIRLEYPQQFGIYALGLIIPSLSFNTCDKNRVPLTQVVPNNTKILYKLLVLNRFAVYFDTVAPDPIDLNYFEAQMKSSMTSKDHQFIFHPLTLECLLLHTRNVPGKLKNELTVSTQQFKITIDYSQCRAILEFNQKWAMFNRRRKYAACARPKNLQAIAETLPGQRRFWIYIYRCAKMKNRPNEFRPELALKILKNRERYVQLYRKKEGQKKGPHPILKKKIKSLDEEIGSQAALFLRQYASAVVQKETQVQNSGITAFDMSELKGILQTGDRFFEMDSFSLEMIVPAFQVELLYSPEHVLASIILAQLTTNVKSVQTHAEIHFGISDLTCVSFIKGELRSLITVERERDSDFLKLITLIPRTADPFSMNIVVESVKTTFDTETIKCVMEFFVTKDEQPKPKKRQQTTPSKSVSMNSFASTDSLSNLDDSETHTTLINKIDAADKLRSLLYFKNHSLRVNFKGLTYVYPFKYKEQDTEVQFAIRDLTVDKTAVGILPNDAPQIKMNFRLKFTIDDLLIAGHCLLSKFVFDLPFDFTFYYGSDTVSIACKFTMSKIGLVITDEALKSISAALNYGKTINLNTGGGFKEEKHELQEKTVFSYGKIRTDLNFSLEEVKLTLNEIEIGMTGIVANYQMLKGQIAGLFRIDSIGFVVNNQNLLNLPRNSTEILLDQKNENEKMVLTFLVHNLHAVLDFRKYKKIYSSVMSLSSEFMEENDIHINNKKETEEEKRIRLEIEKQKKLKKQKENQESSFEFNIRMDGTKFEIPDVLGHYIISFEKILFKDAIVLQKFSMIREGRKVISPTTLAIKMENDTEVTIHGLHSQIDPSDIWAILRLIDEFRELFSDKNDKEKLNDEEPTEYSTYKVSIKNANLELYDKHKPALIVTSNLLNIVTTMNNIDLNVNIDIRNFIGYQVINNRVYKFAYFPREIVDLVDGEEQVAIENDDEYETLNLHYYSSNSNSQLDVNLPKGKIYLTNEVYRYIFKFVPPKDINNIKADDINENDEVKQDENDKQDENNKKVIDSKSKYGAKMISEDCQLELILINKTEETMRLLTKNFSAYVSFVNDDSVNLEVTADSIVGFVNFKDPDFQFLHFPSHFYFRYYHDCITLRSNCVTGRFCHPIVTTLKESIIALISEPTAQENQPIKDNQLIIVDEAKNDQSDEPFKIGFGLVIELDKIEIEIFPSNMKGPHCFSKIDDFKFALKTDQRLSALSIKNIFIDVQNSNPDRALEINDIKAVLLFNDLTKDISDLTIEKILELEDKRDPIPFSFDQLNGNWSVRNVSIQYTHRFAHAVIHNFMNQGKPENVKITLLIPINYEIHNIDYESPQTEEQKSIEQQPTEQPIKQQAEQNEQPVEQPSSEQQIPLQNISDDQKQNEQPVEQPSSEQQIPLQNISDDQKQNELGESHKHSENHKSVEIADTSEKKMDLKADLKIEGFKLGLFLIDPLASIEFLDVTANLNENAWSANVHQFNLYQGGDTKTSLITSPLDSNLIQFKWENNTINIDMAEMTANLDYLFYLNVFNFVLRSPFLHIPSISFSTSASTSTSTATPSSSASMENLKAVDLSHPSDKEGGKKPHPSANNDNISLPFNLNFNAPSLKITVPTSIEKKDYPLFHIEMNVFFNLAEKIMEAKISDFSLHFSDSITKTNYIPILEKVSLVFTRKIEKDKTISISFFMSDVMVKLSAIDFVLFGTMLESINKSTEVMMFSEDNSQYENVSEDEDKQYSLASSFSSLKFNSGRIELIICRDNRSSAQHVPLFQMIIPPIKYDLSTTEKVGSMNLSFEPYIQYYNETTGFWDMILEPFQIQTMGILSNDKFRISFRCEDEMNINLPAKAVMQYMNLASEIKSNMMTIGEKFIELPNFWIENNLGSDVHCKVGQSEKEEDFFLITNGQRIPIYDIKMSTEIYIKFNNKITHFCPKYLTYPLMLNDQIMAMRKPLQGGLCLVLKSCMELYNKLSISVDVFTRPSKNDKFTIIQTIEPKKRLPLYLESKPAEFLITEHDSKTKMKHSILTFSRTMSGTQNFMIGLENKAIKVSLSVKNEVKTGTRLLTLFSPIKAVSHLPVQIQMKWENDEKPIILESEKTIDFFVNEGKNKFKASFSVDGVTYGPLTKLNMKSRDPQKIVAAGYKDENSEEKETKEMTFSVLFDLDEDTTQITASFYTPVGIFNFSSYNMTIFEKDESVDAIVDNFSLWCPKAYFSGKNEVPMNLRFVKNVGDSEFSVVNNFDCTTPRTTNLFTPIMNANNKNNGNLDKAGISYAFRYDISIQSQASILTFNPLLQVHNDLDVDIKLQPVNNNTQKVCGEKYLIKKKSNMMISKMTPAGTFMLIISSFSTFPILSLINEQKIVFKIQSQENSMLIEVETVDVGTNLECHFRPVTFPTPIVICNTLPTTVTAFQLYNVQPFIIEPHSTSVFAFDEPLSYPSAHFFIGEDQIHLSLCLVEDTDYVRTDAMFNGKPIYVSISKIINGSRALSITTKIPKFVNKFTSTYSLNLSRVNISLIDFQTREFALVSLDNFNAELHVMSNYKLIRASIDSLQIDDQDPLTPTPVVLYGRKVPRMPFLSFNCIIPSDAPFMTNITYCSIIFQRIDVEIDSTFLSDVYYILNELTKKLKTTIKPQQKIEKNDSSSVSTFNWLEMSPINILLHYNRKSGRQTRVHKLLSYLKYIPSLSNGKLLLPGVIAANVSDTPSAINEKIMNEYKTQAFNQLIQMLGSGGKLMTAFGVTNLIAEALGVKIESELSNDIQKFSSTETQMEFDNRRKVNGAFSQESLDALSSTIGKAHFRPSEIINKIKSQQTENIGLKTKSVSNNGGGQGVLGVLTKLSNDALSNVPRMDKTARKRVPRAYPNNTISKFDEKISRAQNLIQALSQQERTEVIRIACRSAKQQFVCITDTFVYIIREDFKGIEAKFKITNLADFRVNNKVVSFATSPLLNKAKETQKTQPAKQDGGLSPQQQKKMLQQQQKMQKQSEKQQKKQAQQKQAKQKPPKPEDQQKIPQSEDQQKPSQSEDQQKPSQSEDQQKPSQSEDQQKSQQSEDQQKPSQSEDQQKSQQSEDQQKPSQSEDQQKPSQSEDQQQQPNEQVQQTQSEQPPQSKPQQQQGQQVQNQPQQKDAQQAPPNGQRNGENYCQIVANDKKEAMRIAMFLKSQKVVQDTFGFSLLK
ncbi:hypothetical protein M9Y10_028353 [Tritrichomonas musculus]|uniref:Chorein N-terminal domain-containing protein n=1 Tax=Tritrichomonas musculus TaxID=1915356 RepID=A0ABR2KJU0_9EUKA